MLNATKKKNPHQNSQAVNGNNSDEIMSKTNSTSTEICTMGGQL